MASRQGIEPLLASRLENVKALLFHFTHSTLLRNKDYNINYD